MTYTNTTQNGDLLVALISGNNAIAGNGGYPTGWQPTSIANIAWCVVGTAAGDCPAGTTYVFGGNGALTSGFEFSGANTAAGPYIVYGAPPAPSAVSAGSLNFDLMSASSNAGQTVLVTSITASPQFPVLVQDLNENLEGINTSLYIDEQPLGSAVVPTITVSPSSPDIGTHQFFLSIPPAGVANPDAIRRRAASAGVMK